MQSPPKPQNIRTCVLNRGRNFKARRLHSVSLVVTTFSTYFCTVVSINFICAHMDESGNSCFISSVQENMCSQNISLRESHRVPEGKIWKKNCQVKTWHTTRSAGVLLSKRSDTKGHGIVPFCLCAQNSVVLQQNYFWLQPRLSETFQLFCGKTKASRKWAICIPT